MRETLSKRYPAIADYGQLRPRGLLSLFDYIKRISFLTVSSAPRKTVRVHSEIRNLIPHELYLLGQNDKIEDNDNVQHKLKPADINNTRFITCK